MENTQRWVLVCCQIRSAQLCGHGKYRMYTVNRLWIQFVCCCSYRKTQKEYVQVADSLMMQKEKRES